MAEQDKSQLTASVLPKACENCRARKIRCNRSIPCSNCTTAGITCRPAATAREHRPRILVSNNYEKQMELIHDRLASIEQSLKGLTINSSKTSPSTSSESRVEIEEAPSTPIGFEGDSSFQQQGLRASELAESLNIQQTAELTNEIESLRNLLDTNSDPTVPDQRISFSNTRTKLPEMELLPLAFVIAVLKKIKENIPISSWIMFRADSNVDWFCQRTYFPTEQLSLGERVTMFGLLYHIIQELLMNQDPFAADFDCKAYLEMCGRNMHAGIETYEMTTSATYFNAAALMIGTLKAQDEGRMNHAWILSSTAARHVQMLGYHRRLTYRNDSPAEVEKKLYLFWAIYAADKTLSLVLGRASCIQDWDIDVDYFTPTKDPKYRAWDLTWLNFTKMAKIQGQIYEQLYSSHGARKPHAEKKGIIKQLSSELLPLFEDLLAINTAGAYGQFVLDFINRPADVTYHSLLCLLYRATSSPEEGQEISSKCFNAARNSLQAHLRHLPQFEQAGPFILGAYVNWRLLYCSFTPFIVIFLHALASHSHEDVALLEAVTSSLQAIRSVSSDCDRLYQRCSVFSRIAKVIVDSPQHLLGTYNEQSDSLVFPEASTAQQQAFVSGHNVPDIFVQDGAGTLTTTDLDEMSTFFGNWLGENQPVLDLLNMDFTNDAM